MKIGQRTLEEQRIKKKEKNRRYHQKHRERLLIQKKEYNETHKEHLAKVRKIYEVANKDKIKKKWKEHYRANREKFLARMKKYRKEYRHKIVAYSKKYRIDNPEKEVVWRKANKDRIRLYWKLRYAKRAGKLTLALAQRVYEENIKHYGTLTCYLCLQPIAFRSDTIEHKIPIARGGGNEYENLAIACRSCNNRKNKKTVEEYQEYLNEHKVSALRDYDKGLGV